MKMAENYWQYKSIAETQLSSDEQKSIEETIATPQEIGWQKKFQFTRALNHARNGVATFDELVYLARRNHYYPQTPKHLIIKPV